MTEPSLGRAILCSVLAAVCFAIVRYLHPPEAWSFLLTTLGMILVGAALFYSLDWLMMRIGEWREAWRRADAISERVELVDRISRMSDRQLAALDGYVPVVEILGGVPEPVIQLRTPEGLVPYDFITGAFLPNCTESNLAPIRNWPDGSHDRQYAGWLTDYFIRLGMASESIGNQSARWLNRDAALHFIGVIKNEVEVQCEPA